MSLSNQILFGGINEEKIQTLRHSGGILYIGPNDQPYVLYAAWM